MENPSRSDSAITAELRSLWPQLDWSSVTVLRGAFHRILRFGNASLIRVVLGAAHEERAARELWNLATLNSLDLPYPVPVPLSDVQSFRFGSAYLTNVLSGSIRSEPGWENIRESIATILFTLHSAAPPEGATLRPIRDWCGGTSWPTLVSTIVRHQDGRLRNLAADVAGQVLEIEQAIPRVVVHGDLGPHNILFSEDWSFGLIDFDHACLGDPAIDIAPLIGIYGSAAVADVADAETIRRGRIHRAALPLQVAAAAHIIGDVGLRDHALRSFSDRAEAGTLYGPA